MKAVVTGASGFIGKALTRRLLAQGWLVYAVTSTAEALRDLKCSELIPVDCDFSRYGQLAAQIAAPADCFIHFAWAGVSGAESRQLSVQAENVRAAATAFEQAALLHCRKFLFAGSSYQYRMEPIKKDPQTRFVRKNLYGMAKEAALSLLKAAAYTDDMECSTVFFTNVFGPGDGSNRSTNSILRQLLEGKPLKLIAGEHLHDWTYIDDAVEGILAVLEKGTAGSDYYIGSRHPDTFRSILERVRDSIAPDAELNFGSYDDRAYIDYSMIDLDALYRDTGFECTADFETSIRRTAEWLRENTRI